MPLKPKPRPVSAQEWERRWRKLRWRVRVQAKLFSLLSVRRDSALESRKRWLTVAQQMSAMLQEMSRLTRRPTRRQER